MLLKGFILGFSIAAPVGPIGLLCIQRTLNRGRLHGFCSGLGAASADTVYGVIAALGLTTVSSFLRGLQFWLQLGGGLFLLWLGGRTLLARPVVSTHTSSPERTSLAAAYVSIFLLTLANPATILAFVAVFAGFGISTQTDGPPAALGLVTGIFLGSSAWWLILSFLAGLLRDRLNAGSLRLISVVAGLSILALGLWSIVRAKLL